MNINERLYGIKHMIVGRPLDVTDKAQEMNLEHPHLSRMNGLDPNLKPKPTMIVERLFFMLTRRAG
jgi:hypothetical protein